VDRLWFRDDEDFRVAMNYVAIAAFLSGILVLSFILMSNHVHFVVSGNREKVLLFMNICLEPSGYPWGSGSTLFTNQAVAGQSLGELSRRAQIRLLKSNVKLPGTYRITPEGYVSPSSYIPVRGVEALFRTPKRLGFFLRTSSKARLRVEGKAVPSFRDQIISAACTDLCKSLFRAEGIQELSQEQKAELLRQLGHRFSADLKQLCRVTGLPYEEAAKLLDSFR